MQDNTLIVVGVDGSDGGRRALRWAVEEAIRCGGAVEAVTAWQWDGYEGALMAATNPAAERARAETLLANEVAAVTAELGSPVPIACEVVEGRPGKVLAAAATRAHLLVVGSHGHGRLRHALVGSVAEECIRDAACPVTVVPVPHPVTERPIATAAPAS